MSMTPQEFFDANGYWPTIRVPRKVSPKEQTAEVAKRSHSPVRLRTIDVTFEEWEEFRKLGQLQTPRSRYYQRRQFVAIFSVNARGHKWSFQTYGQTPFSRRNDLRGNRVVESLRKEYATLKQAGGRVFVDGAGAYYKTAARKLVRFAAFRFPPVVYKEPESDCDTSSSGY